MALEQVFECPSTLKKLRSDPLGEILDGFCKWLLQKRFSRSKSKDSPNPSESVGNTFRHGSCYPLLKSASLVFRPERASTN